MASIKLTIAVKQEVNRYIGYRCLHMAEGGYPNPESMPCVRPSYNSRPVTFTKGMQELSYYDLNKYNPNLTKSKWRVVYGNGTAFTNGSGFDKENDPRADWINLRDLGESSPALQKGIICSGMFIRGEKEGNFLKCTPGIHAINANAPLPPLEEIVRKNWYFHATTGGMGRVSNFPQGGGLPVIIPFILREVTYYKLTGIQNGVYYTNFTEWNSNELPEPTKFYNPI